MGIVLLGAAAGLAFAVRNHLSTPFDPLFDAAGARHQVPSNLLRAIAWWESRGMFNAGAISPSNANGTRDYGLMQINERTGAALGFTTTQLLDPATSIDAAARWLVKLRQELGSRFSSFSWPAAYNVGSDLSPSAAANAYASAVFWHWGLYDVGRSLAGRTV